MRNPPENIQLTLGFLNAVFLVLHLSYCILMTFLMMVTVILLFMLMILLSTLSLVGHMICGNNERWLLNLNLTYEILLWNGAGSDMLISMLEKVNLFCLTGLIALVL